FEYLQSFSRHDLHGFLTHRPEGSDGGTDALTTAHLGLVCLHFGEVERARRAGHLLAHLLSIQPDLNEGFLLRLDGSGRLVRDVPGGAAAFYVVSRREPDQAYFMIGYPMGFLAKLSQATGEDAHLQAARGYLEFALGCGDKLRSSHFSHKVAWAAAVLARITGDERCLELSTAIADHLLGIQDPSGAWLADQPVHTVFDQTAEIAIWLQEISAELNGRSLEEVRAGTLAGC
ncbi:MAG TPA: hypothetical protein VKL22_01885, partial [Actinomycetota bacterium]|nr:hypothetical protein [Actinomycetota bacterium]